MVDTRCRVCGTETEALQRDGGSIAPCSVRGCSGERERVFKSNPVRAAVHGDEIPGGVWMKHGICNEDGTPKRYDSKHDIVRALDKAGLRPLDEPIPVLDAEIERNLHRKGFANTPRCAAIPGVLTAADEVTRVQHWRDTEAQLQRTLAKDTK